MTNEEFTLTITANEVTSTDLRFTMKNLDVSSYKAIDTYYQKSTGEIVRREKDKGERRISNQTMPKLAFQVFESLIDKLSEDDRIDFPICQYTPEKKVIRGIYLSIDEFKRYKNSNENLEYISNGKVKYVIYCWPIFSTVYFVKECLKRFGNPDDKFVLIYKEKEKTDIEETTDKEDEKQFVEFANFTEGGINRIYYGAPGTGKSWTVKEFVSSSYDKNWRTTLHPEYTYFDFVGGLKPIQDKAIEKMSYDFYPGPFTEALIYSYKHPTEKVALIVEEINRANTAAVFGDIFQLLDRDDEGSSEYGIYNRELLDYLENEHGIILPNNQIVLPSNYSIVATMNSADQGVFVMDSAFKRRWEFEYIPIDFASHPDVGGLEMAGFSVSWQFFAETLNNHLASMGIPEDKLIGPRFLKKKDIQDKNKIASKLLIYLWDDVVRYKRGDLFKERSRFSEVMLNFSNGRQVFVNDLHDKLKAQDDNGSLEE